ncbi:MAG: hypothetical protein JWN70_3735 [Planctomycetaceae bacterium]|nr:hypothetical protein [Planctomycetaceae bacterium]
MSQLRYELMPLESGVFAELYLPKKAHYQGLLYETLTNGFDVENVRKHLRGKRKQIQAYLGGAAQYWEITGKNSPSPDQFLNENFIKKFPDLLYGYTMYEVDGVFRSPHTGQVVEERTQIIRLMFISDLDQVFAALPFVDESNRGAVTLLARSYLRSTHWDRDRFLEDHKLFPSASVFDDKEAAAIIHLTADWARSIAVFLFGYVVHDICEGLRKLNQNDVIAPEEEIWETMFWNLIINRIRSVP